MSAWAALVERIVKDPSGPQALVTRTRDDIPVEPLYPQRHPGRAVEARSGRWRVFQRVDHPDVKEANALAISDIEGGAEGLEIVFPGSAAAHGYGVGVTNLNEFDRLLDGVDLETVPLRLDGGYEVRQAVGLVAALVERRRADPARIDVVAESDPANGLFSGGRLVVPYEIAGNWGADMVFGLLKRGLRLPVFVGEGRAVHAAGGTEVQELAYALASALEHLRMLESRGVAIEDAAGMVTVTLAADADQFLTIAKLRALRLTWARVAEMARLPDATMRLHAETSWRMMTRYDPWVNILRATVATAAAGLGGADSVLTLPFTQARGLPNAFARRIARNLQLVLLHEAGLADVSDPGAGSGYIEAMTEALAERAWARFREIEREGGIIAAVRSGRFQAEVLDARSRRMADAARRVESVVGVSEYPWLEELPVETLRCEPHEIHSSGERVALPEPGNGERFDALVAHIQQGATMADLLATIGYEWERSKAAPWWRIAEPFERLRDAAEPHRARGGSRPSIFLANLGTEAEFATRSRWAQNLLAVGGIAAVSGAGGSDASEIAREFANSGTGVACLCPGEGRADLVAEAARWLKMAGARHVLCVRPPDGEEALLREAGVDVLLSEGCDILAELEALHARLALGAKPSGDARSS